MVDNPDSPESQFSTPLPQGSMVYAFTPDATLGWAVAYAGPCGEKDCDEGEAHTRLYAVPVVGWLHVSVPDVAGTTLRPAIMLASGEVRDYLSVSAKYKFIGVLRVTEEFPEMARELYRKRFGGQEVMHVERRDMLN